MHETARLRVNLELERDEQEARADAQPAGEVDMLADVNNQARDRPLCFVYTCRRLIDLLYIHAGD